MPQFNFYNKGLKKAEPLRTIHQFSKLYQEDGNSEAPLRKDLDVRELKLLIKELGEHIYFYAFAAEESALFSHILECLNDGLLEYRKKIIDATVARNSVVWDEMFEIIVKAYID